MEIRSPRFGIYWADRKQRDLVRRHGNMLIYNCCVLLCGCFLDDRFLALWVYTVPFWLVATGADSAHGDWRSLGIAIARPVIRTSIA